MATKPTRTRLLIALASVGLAAGAAVATTSAAGATTPRNSAPAEQAPVTTGSNYLALGDSVPFGYREPDTSPTPNYTKPSSIVGYPAILARDLGLKLTNASCPGETSSSFIDTTAASNGCENSYDPSSGQQVPIGYRTSYPLHVKYAGPAVSQLQYAVRFLKSHPNTSLVSLMIGANDGILCQKMNDGTCPPEQLPGVVQKIEQNLEKILGRIRNYAGYTGQIVIVDYYSTDYTDTDYSAQIKFLNTAINNTAANYDVEIADGYAAFQRAAQNAGGDTCKAGLLTFSPSSASGCGIHPSLGGHALLSDSVARVITKG